MNSALEYGRFKGRPIVLFPEGWNHGWAAPDVNFVFARMKPTEWKEWRENYYAGLMACPFGYESPKPLTGQWQPLAPWRISIHGEPRLHPDDE